MTIDLDQRLTDLRRAPVWAADERGDLLNAVLATDPSPRRGDLRLVAATRSP